MRKPEVLSPVGDFECLKAAVQNGADSVYLGAGSFNARARATNFDKETLAKAIKYAKLHDVKVHVTINILIKNNEFDDAVSLAVECYNLGADAIIVQDLGLLMYLKENYPEITLHASTQMTTHNLEGVKQLEALGIPRVVLARELSINEIQNICKNTNIEIETFIHGALCISYSGQCLFSSIVGGRSGNRGLCAQPCRLPYTLLDENENTLNKGYLLSPRDFLGVEYLPELIKAGVSSFKIEGRLKKPEYVAIATRFYRKYVDLVCENIGKSNEELHSLIREELKKINETTFMSQKEEITQIFNRGGFSSGHILPTSNNELIYKQKSSNTGFYLGKVEHFNPNKGYVKLKANHHISLGDKIEINSNTYTISELMIGNNNIKNAKINDFITVGRIKGDIKLNIPIYKIQSKELVNSVKNTFEEDKEFKKIKLNSKIKIIENEPISLEVWCENKDSIYYGEKINVTSEIMATKAINKPLDNDSIIKQISKTGSTQFEFENIEIILDENLFIPKLSVLNELRRDALSKLEEKIIEKHIQKRNLEFKPFKNEIITKFYTNKKICLLLNTLDLNFDYTYLTNIEKLYIPFKYFRNSLYKAQIESLCEKFKTYVYMPSILRDLKYKDFSFLNNFNLKGAVISNISQTELFKDYKNFELIGNYTLNVYNSNTVNYLKTLNFSSYMVTPELNDENAKELIKTSSINTELLVYGRIPLMTMNYCLLGNSNHCYKECDRKCNLNKKYFIKDRIDLKFRIVPDNSSTITTIYNSKITSFDYSVFNPDFVRINILDENPSEIQNIIDVVLNSKRFEGKEYCGHFNQ